MVLNPLHHTNTYLFISKQILTDGTICEVLRQIYRPRSGGGGCPDRLFQLGRKAFIRMPDVIDELRDYGN